MDINLSYVLQGVILLLIGLVLWLIKRNTDKVERLGNEMAVVNHIVKSVGADHDRLIQIQSNQQKIVRDIDQAHIKIRELSKTQHQ